MLVTKKPKRLDVPHEQGEWFDVVPLSWKALDDARDKAQEKSVEQMKKLGAELMKAMRSEDEEKVRRVLRRQRYEEQNFDTLAVLKEGVLDWSYTNGNGEKVNVDEQTLKHLDETTMVWCKQAIIDLSRPPDEDEEKNSSGGSTDT